MNGMYRVESDNSVDADEPIMKHMTEGGVTILKQLERRKQPPLVCIHEHECSFIIPRLVQSGIILL